MAGGGWWDEGRRSSANRPADWRGVVSAATEQQREGEGICDQILGFECSLADRTGPFPLFSRSESPSVPRGTGDGLGSPDGWRPKSGGNRGTGGAAGPIYAVRMTKSAAGDLVGEMGGDALKIVPKNLWTKA
jgi:hypothetical protein